MDNKELYEKIKEELRKELMEEIKKELNELRELIDKIQKQTRKNYTVIQSQLTILNDKTSLKVIRLNIKFNLMELKEYETRNIYSSAQEKEGVQLEKKINSTMSEEKFLEERLEYLQKDYEEKCNRIDY